MIAPILLICLAIYCCHYCKKEKELKAKVDANATTPLLAEPQTYPVVVPAGAGQCGNQPVRQAGLDVLLTILAASTQRERAWCPRARRLRLTHPDVFFRTGAGPGDKIKVKNPQTGADVNVIVPAGVTAGGQFLVPMKPAGDENI